jgi:transmembrane sensor
MTNESPRPKQPAQPIDWEAVARFLVGESSPGEAAAFRRWMDEDSDRAAMIGALDRATSTLYRQLPTDVDVEHALRQVSARLDAPVDRPVRVSHGPMRRARLTPLRVAGLTALAAAAGIVALMFVSRRGPIGADAPRARAAARTYVTAIGIRDSVTLIDGTRIILGGESRLVVPADYGRAQRTVTLEGLAFFDVAHDGSKPFTVHSAKAIVEDIGTQFVLRDEPDGGVSVSVADGVVRLRPAVGDPASGVVLRVGDRGLADSTGRVEAFPGGADRNAQAWTSGQRIFKDAPLSRVQDELRRWYGVDLRIADSSLARQHVNANVTSEPLAVVLRVIALDLGARLEVRGDTAIMHAVPAPRSPR